MRPSNRRDLIWGLQAEIQDAGRLTRRSRLELGGLMLCLGVTSLLFPAVPHDRWNLFLHAMIIRVALSAGILAAPQAALYRRLRRAQLRRKLAALPGDQVAAILLPLRDEPGDTGKIVLPLLREMRVSLEVGPADAPTEGGNEAAPTD